jgi:hypothetical protein
MSLQRATPSAAAEYTCLLEIGRHTVSLASLESLCVGPFPKSRNRPMLMTGISGFIALLKERNVSGEVWVGGSFLTEKPEPADIDLVLSISSELVDSASSELGDFLNCIGNIDIKEYVAIEDAKSVIKRDFNCDFHMLIQYPRISNEYWFGEYMYSYYMKLLGWGRSPDDMKGIAVVEL